jgi:translation initiation factor 4E
LWTSTKVKSDNWLDTIKKISMIDTIEDFWAVFNNIPEASNLKFPFDYYFFRSNILPMWEDASNANGGKMTITLKKTHDAEFFNKIWIYTVLGCIGEQFESIICGIVLNIRKHQDRINIWVDTNNEEEIKTIGLKWKELLEVYKISISYIKHSDTSINYIM